MLCLLASAEGMQDGSDRAYAKRGGKFSPDVLVQEPGAVMCTIGQYRTASPTRLDRIAYAAGRVSRSFLRFSHLELFAQRGELDELRQIADYVCFREYPHLLLVSGPARYVQLLREVAGNAAKLVSEWLRVGYVQVLLRLSLLPIASMVILITCFF